MLTLYNPSGVMTLDGSRKVFKFLGSITVGGVGSPQSGFVDHGMFAQGRPYPFVFVEDGTYSPVGQDLVVDFSGTRMTWAYPSPDASKPQNRKTTTIVYGVF